MSFARLTSQLSSSSTQPHLSILPNQSLQHTFASSNVNLDHRNNQQMHKKPISNPTGSTPRSASVLNNAKKNHIHDNVITTNNTNISYSASPLDLLYQSVAPNAILNSGGRADEVKCHPGTREEVIGLVAKSIAQQYAEPQMLWLSGPAGAGKSAIMQTVAERCRDQDVPHANFFFFRGDSSRKDASPFVATIMHQIIKRYPSVGAAVEATLTSDPLLFRMGVQQQFHDLLHHALATLYETLPSPPPIALLIDGLDECDSEGKTEQRQLLQALDDLLIQKGLHFRVVIASRVEPQISMAFGQLRSQVNSIFLDDKYAPETDIRRFVTAEFDKIKKSHYLAHKLGPHWPSESDISGIVSKSSGQFIFAATVMRFMMYSPASPILSLQRVQRIVPPNKNSPFSHLDTVYAYILGQVEDLEPVKVLLSIKLLAHSVDYLSVPLMSAYRSSFTEAVVDSCLSELTPLVTVKDCSLEFFHASFPDFLQDETRSKEYYIDLDTFCTALTLKRVQQPTREMTTALMERKPINSHPHSFLDDIVAQLHRIYAPKDLELFNQIMHMWVSHDPSFAQHIPQKYFQATSQKHSSDFHMDQLNQETQSSALQTHPSISLTHSHSRQICPAASQRRLSPQQLPPSLRDISMSTFQAYPPAPHNPVEGEPLPPIPQTRSPTPKTRAPSLRTSQSTPNMHSPTPQARPAQSPLRAFGCQLLAPISQTRSFTIRTRTYNPETPPPTPKTRSPSPNTRQSTSNTRPPTPQAHPAPSHVRGFVRQVIPPILGRTETVTPQTRASTPMSHPSTPQARPVSPQTHQGCMPGKSGKDCSVQ